MKFGFRALSDRGILGMNARIGRYMNGLNPRRLFPRVDDKVLTAEICRQHGAAHPENFHVYSTQGQLRDLAALLDRHPEFVVKPARGTMGNGILVMSNRDGSYVRSNGETWDFARLRHHISQIISGLYSISGHTDQAIIQERILLHETFSGYAVNGIPDVRVIVFRGYPVMAMVRLPTAESGGRANLHQGAIGLGLDMLTGRSVAGVHRDRMIDLIPGTEKSVDSLVIPEWETILSVAARGYEMTGLGYLGVDIAIDPRKGPLILEMNARPGLSIQLANRKGLALVLRKFSAAIPAGNPDPEERLRIASLLHRETEKK